MICSKIYKICINVGMCEMCRPDTHAFAGELNQYGRLSLGGPFRGFSLAHSEQWISSYHYNLSEECYNKLVGQIDISVEVKSQGNNRWESVIQDKVDFGKKPFHLQKMIGGVQSIPIYTEKWKMRKK